MADETPSNSAGVISNEDFLEMRSTLISLSSQKNVFHGIMFLTIATIYVMIVDRFGYASFEQFPLAITIHVPVVFAFTYFAGRFYYYSNQINTWNNSNRISYISWYEDNLEKPGFKANSPDTLYSLQKYAETKLKERHPNRYIIVKTFSGEIQFLFPLTFGLSISVIHAITILFWNITDSIVIALLAFSGMLVSLILSLYLILLKLSKKEKD